MESHGTIAEQSALPPMPVQALEALNMSHIRSHLQATSCPPTNVSLRIASTEADFQSFRSLSLEYADWLGEKLCFQGFEQEMAGLPGCYARPEGCIILAAVSPHPPAGTGELVSPRDVGCVAVRPFQAASKATGGAAQQHCSSGEDEQAAAAAGAPGDLDGSTAVCEMKRLYVTEEAKGLGIGRLLVEQVLQEAKAAGYHKMVLDTLERLRAANKLYESFSFVQRAPYYHNPLGNVVFWEREL